MKIKNPVGPWILVERIQEDKTKDVLMTVNKEKDYIPCKVLKLGTGVTLANGNRTEFDVREGDLVLCKNFGGITVNDEGKDYIFLYQSDIISILE